ncbi:MAG: cupin domain-containing protein [Rhodocyclaceae bacterium]
MQARILPLDPDSEYWFAEGCFILEMLNTSGDPALSIARARVRAGGVTRWHRLRGIAERYVIQSGSGIVELGDPANPTQQQVVGPGDVVLIPPGCAQRIRNTSGNELVFLALCTPRFVKSAYENCEPDAAN